MVTTVSWETVETIYNRKYIILLNMLYNDHYFSENLKNYVCFIRRTCSVTCKTCFAQKNNTFCNFLLAKLT